MSHCVASYVDECFSGTSTIFSLRKYTGESFEKLATIEIDPGSREIIQAKAKYNQSLSKEAKEIVNIWIKQINLRQEEYSYMASHEIRPVQDQIHVLERVTAFQETNSDIEVSKKSIFYILYAIIQLMIFLSHIL